EAGPRAPAGADTRAEAPRPRSRPAGTSPGVTPLVRRECSDRPIRTYTEGQRGRVCPQPDPRSARMNAGRPHLRVIRLAASLVALLAASAAWPETGAF